MFVTSEISARERRSATLLLPTRRVSPRELHRLVFESSRTRFGRKAFRTILQETRETTRFMLNRCTTCT